MENGDARCTQSALFILIICTTSSRVVFSLLYMYPLKL